jgi:hypothetical protein
LDFYIGKWPFWINTTLQGTSDHIQAPQIQFENLPRTILTSNPSSIREHNINIGLIPIQYRKEAFSMWKKKKVKPEQLAVNVSEETRRTIEEEAEAEDMSISSWIGRAIEKYFETKNNEGRMPK